jgi:hypothetical protein
MAPTPNHPVDQAFGYFRHGRSQHVPNQNYWLLSGGSGDTGFGAKLMTSSTIRFLQQDIVSRGEQQNVDAGALFTAGAWHLVEYVAVLSGVDAADGEFHMWIDGVKIHEYTDVLYRPANERRIWSSPWSADWAEMPGRANPRRRRLDRPLLHEWHRALITEPATGSPLAACYGTGNGGWRWGSACLG